MAKVRCSDCGFLALRDGGRKLCEADDYSRKSGNLPNGFQKEIACFVIAQPINSEPTGTSPADFVAVISKERECADFSQWRPDYSPKEHAEMLQIKEQREWQKAQRQNDLEWRKSQENDRRQWELKNKRMDRLWAVILLIVGAFLGAWLKGGPAQPAVTNEKLPPKITPSVTDQAPNGR